MKRKDVKTLTSLLFLSAGLLNFLNAMLNPNTEVKILSVIAGTLFIVAGIAFTKNWKLKLKW